MNTKLYKTLLEDVDKEVGNIIKKNILCNIINMIDEYDDNINIEEWPLIEPIEDPHDCDDAVYCYIFRTMVHPKSKQIIKQNILNIDKNSRM